MTTFEDIEFWSQSTRETYERLLSILNTKYYVPPDIAIDMLTTAYFAAAQEFGD